MAGPRTGHAILPAAGISVYFRDPDGSLFEFIAYDG
jgi:catechol 2,3-dioxygenase-like lactoylglutathione lyase family enzyme